MMLYLKISGSVQSDFYQRKKEKDGQKYMYYLNVASFKFGFTISSPGEKGLFCFFVCLFVWLVLI